MISQNEVHMEGTAPGSGGEAAQTDKEPIAAPEPQAIVLIHGTAAAAESDVGERWWQRGSTFSSRLDDLAQPFAQCLEKELFHWSGSNSERDRRFYGQRLYQRYIRPFEEQRRPYHLVGHSHGGGVIFGALVEAVRRDHRLEYLHSWSTLGTPFLSYRARPKHWSWVLPIVAVLVSLSWLIPLGTEYFSHRSDLIRSRNLTAVVLPPLLIGLPIAIALLVLVSWALSLMRRLRSAEYLAHRERVVSQYGGRWMGIAANVDEAINGLGSTLTLRSNVAWRLPELRNLGWSLRIILAPFWLVTRLYNIFIAAAADEFIWSLTTRRLQGSDLQSQVLTAVSRDLQPGSFELTPLPSEVETEIVFNANADSAGTLASIRAVLGLASQSSDSGNTLLAGFRKAMTWNELVHTSYMRYPAVNDLVARHILHLLKPGHPEDAMPVAPAVATNVPTTSALPKLSIVVNGSLAIVVGLMVLLGAVVTRAFVGPYTDQFQVDAIWAQLHDPEISNPHGASFGFSSVLAAHALIVKDGKDEKLSSGIQSPHTKHLAMQWVAEADALANNLKAAQELVNSIDDASAAAYAKVGVYHELASIGNCSAAETFLQGAREATKTSDDFLLFLPFADGLKACGRRQDALDLIHKTVEAVKSKSWDASSVPSELARMDEEGETTAAIVELFKTPADASHQLIAAATVFMSQGNAAAAARLVSKIEPDKVMPADSVAALKLYARLDDLTAMAWIMSGSSVNCHELAQLGEIFLRKNAKDRVSEIEQLMIDSARAFPIQSRVAECFLDVSLLETSSGDSANGNKAFAAATKLIGQMPDKDGFRANLSGLAAEVGLRSHFDRDHISQLLSNAQSDAERLSSAPAFAILIRLADVALSMGNKEHLETILKSAEEAIGRDTEYQSRSPKYRRLAERYAEAGWYRDARLIAERSVIGDERLKAFATIVWKIRERDTPLLRPLLGIAKNEQGDFDLMEFNPNEQKQADKEDEQQLIMIGLGPVCPIECSRVH